MAAVAMLVVFAAAPALAAVCAARCVDLHPAAASPVPSCHETRHDSPRLEGDAADPCATHELASAEAATRAQLREEATPAPATAVSPLPAPQLAGRRASAVTPGAPRPGPSRPPLVLRL
jgi:hypothetical protein